jgi:acylphosphatase
MTVRRRVVVHGRVQGVGFRISVARCAKQRGVGGWVQNRFDGAVEAAFEGEPGSVESLVDYCRRGPRGASVERIEVTDEAPEGVSWFDVR